MPVNNANYSDRRWGLLAHRRRVRREKRKERRRLRRQGHLMAGSRRRPKGWPRHRFDGQSYDWERWYGSPWTCNHAGGNQ